MPKGKKKSKLQRKKSLLLNKYNNWKKVKCPALNAHVHFTRLGWDHLVERKKRNKKEYLRRLEMIPYARKIIKKSTTLQSQNWNKGIQYTNLIAVMGGITIKVTITRKGKKYTFFSIRRLA